MNKTKEYIKHYPEGKIFAPNSIYHTLPVGRGLSKGASLRIELERMRDFIEWLFTEDNIHWMSQREAWEKFDELEIKEMLQEDKT